MTYANNDYSFPVVLEINYMSGRLVKTVCLKVFLAYQTRPSGARWT